MKNVKRYLAVILTVLITLTSFPISALADEVHTDASGSTDEFVWSYDSESDTLYINTINGNTKLYFDQWDIEDMGFLPTYATQEAQVNKERVWDSSFVSNIVIGKDIEEMENVSFYYFGGKEDFGYKNLKSVTFEEGSQLKKIGDDVFASSLITSVELPYGLESLGMLAFASSKLTEIVIPDTVYKIDDLAFQDCEGLERVTLPSYKGDKEIYYGSHIFADCCKLTDIDFGSTITTIPYGMFDSCTALKSITIPNAITYIDEYAFSCCTNLESITLSKNLNKIGMYAFENCEKLSDVDFSRVKSNVELEQYAFIDCTQLTTISMPTAPSKIGSYCFKNSGLTTFETAQPIDEIGEYAFAECKSITNIDLSRVRKIGSYAFKDSGLSSVCSINFTSTLEEIGAHAFDGTNITRLDLSDTNIIDIPANAFRSEANIEEIILPDNLSTIGSYALSGTSIEELTIPDSVTSLGGGFCADCPELVFVCMPDHSALTVIPSCAFYNCTELTGVDNIDSIKTISNKAFAKCTNLQWVDYFESQLEKIGENAFNGCVSLNEFNFPKTIKSIGSYSFSACSSITKVDLSECDAIEELGKGAFANTSSLESFKFPKRNAVVIPESFLADSGVYDLSIPTATSIEKKAFTGTAMRELILPDNCKTISEDAFANCKNLSYVRMPYAYVPGRFYNPFTNSTNITTMIYPSRESFTYDERKYTTYGFLAWNGLTVYGYADTDIQKYCEKHNIDFSVLEEEIENNINENSYLSITKKGTCENGTWRLYNKSGYSGGYTLEVLVDGDIKDDVLVCDNGRITTYKELARTYQLCYAEFGEGVTSICDNLFYDAERGINNAFSYGVSFPSTLKSIGKNAFRNMWQFSKVVIPDNVTEIGEYAFADNLQLHRITIGDGITELKEGTFYASNPSLILKLPANLKSIGKKAFAGITKTGDGSKNTIWFSIPESVEYIYNDPVHPENNAFGFNTLGVIDDEKVCFKVHYGTVGYKYVKQYCLKYSLLSGTETEEEINYVPEINYREVNWGYLSSENLINNQGLDYSRIKWVYNKFDKTLTINGGGFYTALGTLTFYRADKTQVKQGELDVDTIIINGINTISVSEKEPLANLTMFNPKNIVLDDSLTRIEKNAFKDCTRLQSITIPDSVTYLDSTVFTNCTSLKAVSFGAGVKTIPANILKDHSQLEYVTIPDGCTSIGGGAFRNCINIHEINIPDSVITIGSYAFYKDIGLNKITLGKGVNSVGTKAFNGAVFCQKLIINSEISPKNTIENLKKNEAFGMLGASNTGAQLIFADVETANLACFYNANISEINISDSVTQVKRVVEMPKLKKVTVNENNENYYAYNNALYSSDNALVLGPRAVTDLSIKDGTTLIAENAFLGSSLKSITIPDSVTKIDKYAFAESYELKTISFGDSLEEIAQYSFQNCVKIKFLYFPESLQVINTSAFEGATNLSSIIFNEGLIAIAPFCFRNCDSLKDVVLNESLGYLGWNSFANCDNLERVYAFSPEYLDSPVFEGSENAKFYTMVGTTVYEKARENNIPYVAYTDEDCFYDDVAVKLDSLAGYLGYCENGHGDIQYLTVYEPSCTQDGYIIGVCEYCSVILEEKHIDACGHNYVNSVSIPATERTNGIEKYDCTNCNDTYTVYTPALDSDLSENTMCKITGSVVIANDKNATQGSTPLSAVDVSLGGETLATTDENGEFSFSLETGSYELVLHYNYGFDRTVYLVVTDEDIDMGAIPIIACDWNKDGVINDDDYVLFRLVVGATSDSPSYLSFVDMNNDGKINVKDLVYMNNVKGIDSSSFEYPNIVIGV